MNKLFEILDLSLLGFRPEELPTFLELPTCNPLSLPTCKVGKSYQLEALGGLNEDSYYYNHKLTNVYWYTYKSGTILHLTCIFTYNLYNTPREKGTHHYYPHFTEGKKCSTKRLVISVTLAPRILTLATWCQELTTTSDLCRERLHIDMVRRVNRGWDG